MEDCTFKISSYFLCTYQNGLQILRQKEGYFMKVGIYNHQHYRGGCPGCSQTYVKGMISDAEKCKAVVRRLYKGQEFEFFNYTDLGDYPADNVDRPGYKRLIADIEAGNLDIVITTNPTKISNNINLIVDFYKTCKANKVTFLTSNEGKDIETFLDILINKQPRKTLEV